MMELLESMRRKLEPLEVYALDGSTIIDAELKAYAAGLQPVFEKLKELECEIFLETAQSYGLDYREQSIGPERKNVPVGKRREMLLFRNSVTVNDHTRGAIEKAVIASGLRAAISENILEQKIYINCLEILNQFDGENEIIKAAAEFLPAHLEYEFDLGTLSWDTIDRNEYSFDQMDASSMNWDEIDTIF